MYMMTNERRWKRDDLDGHSVSFEVVGLTRTSPLHGMIALSSSPVNQGNSVALRSFMEFLES
jgi:hypothetical protein